MAIVITSVNPSGVPSNEITLIAANAQTYAYFSTPVRCLYKNILWILHEGRFEKEEDRKRTQLIGGGYGFATNLNILSKKKNPRKILHFYRAARDESNPLDYRTLQLWRFFEGWFNKQGKELVNELIGLGSVTESSGWDIKTNKQIFVKYKITKSGVEGFYRNYRSAVAHGGGASKNHSKKIIYPGLVDFMDDVDTKLFYMLKVADEILRKPKSRLFL